MRPSKVVRYFLTPKGLLLLVLLALVGIAYPSDGMKALARVDVAVSTAVIVDLLFMYAAGKWELPDSAILTGLIAGMVLGPAVPIGVPILASALAITSKRLIRGKRGHFLNPAAVGLLLVGLLFSTEQSWWGGLGDAPAVLIVAVAGLGLLVVNRVNKLPTVLTFLGAYMLLLTLGSLFGNPQSFADAFREPETGAALYFACFMLTDPPTSPTRPRDQMVFAAIAACVSVASLATNLGGVYYLLFGLLAGNVYEAARRGLVSSIKRRQPSAPRRTAEPLLRL
jgi:Na+-translocating ferredoxin:NAD+ oxidoreductase RnfD subunit